MNCLNFIKRANFLVLWTEKNKNRGRISLSARYIANLPLPCRNPPTIPALGEIHVVFVCANARCFCRLDQGNATYTRARLHSIAWKEANLLRRQDFALKPQREMFALRISVRLLYVSTISTTLKQQLTTAQIYCPAGRERKRERAPYSSHGDDS